jgi:HPt (histidine-containing phosphotransfer) domain-containing protein
VGGVDDTTLGGGDELATAAVLDPAAIRSLGDLTGDDQSLIAELVGAFLEDAPERLAEIRTGLGASDEALVGRAAHTLKANALTFGALDFAAACRDLEETARAGGGLDEGEELATLIEAEWVRARPSIADLAS